MTSSKFAQLGRLQKPPSICKKGPPRELPDRLPDIIIACVHWQLTHPYYPMLDLRIAFNLHLDEGQPTTTWTGVATGPDYTITITLKQEGDPNNYDLSYQAIYQAWAWGPYHAQLTIDTTKPIDTGWLSYTVEPEHPMPVRLLILE